MRFTLIYSPSVEAARAFLSEFDGKGDIVETPIGHFPLDISFFGYPTVVYEDTTGGYHTKYLPKTWQEVQSWAEFIELKLATPPPVVYKVEYTKTEFKRLFTLEELNALLVANEAPLYSGSVLIDSEEREKLLDVKRMWNILSDSEFVSMKDPLTINSLYLLVLDGYLTEARFDEIKKGVFKI